MNASAKPPSRFGMLQVQTDQALDQLRLALEQERRDQVFHGPVWVLWGVIVAKVLLAEWAIRVWAVPISSFYIWGPTLLIGGACTLAWGASIGATFAQRPATSRFLGAVWGATGMALMTLILAARLGGAFDAWLLPGLAALLYGTALFVHGSLGERQLYRWAALLWWIGALVLLAWTGVHTLALLAGLVVVGHIVPVSVRWWQLRRG